MTHYKGNYEPPQNARKGGKPDNPKKSNGSFEKSQPSWPSADDGAAVNDIAEGDEAQNRRGKMQKEDKAEGDR